MTLHRFFWHWLASGLVLSVLWMLSAVSVEAATNDGVEEINHYDVDITLGESGLLTVVEVIQYDFDWYPGHGIYRSIPYRYTRKFYNDNLDIQLISVTGKDPIL